MIRTVGNYKFKFFRVDNDKGHRVDTVCQIFPSGLTDKYLRKNLVDNKFPQPLVEGEAFLHPKDSGKFDKVLGKRIALAHAFRAARNHHSELDFTREERKEIFSQIFGE
jgi:hypothetical protein